MPAPPFDARAARALVALRAREPRPYSIAGDVIINRTACIARKETIT
jgi:hypothetical protein